MISDFEDRLNLASVALDDLYATLTTLADQLDPMSLVPPESPTLSEAMDNLGQQMALSSIQQHVLAARHAIHGGLSQIVSARIEVIRARREP